MRIASNPYGEVFLHDIGDGNSLLYVESTDRHGRRTSVSIPLNVAEVGALARFAYYELALPQERELAKREEPVEAESYVAPPPARPVAPSRPAALPAARGRPPGAGPVDYEEFVRVYRELGGRREDVEERLSITSHAYYKRLKRAQELGLLPRGKSKGTRGRKMPPRGSIDYAEVARLYMSDAAAGSGIGRKRYVMGELGLSATTAANRITRARALGLIPAGWYADGYGPVGPSRNGSAEAAPEPVR